MLRRAFACVRHGADKDGNKDGHEDEHGWKRGCKRGSAEGANVFTLGGGLRAILRGQKKRQLQQR
eukprot:8003783-Lingulodinium_polyedra.AAC.1